MMAYISLDKISRGSSARRRTRFSMENRGVSVSRGNIPSLIDSISYVLIKLEGVLWIGDKRLLGASEIVGKLHEMDKKIIFITNEDTMTRQQILTRLTDYGIKEADLNSIISCGYATATYLKKKLRVSKVFCLGPEGLVQEIKLQGIEVLSWKHDDSTETSMKEFLQENQVKVIVLGLYSKFSFQISLAIASYLRRNKDVYLVSTNKQSTFLTHNGILLPGVGSLLSMIKEMGSKHPDYIVGEPEEPFLRILMSSQVIIPDKTLLIGDRLDTDMLFAFKSGFISLLSLSGSTDLAEAQMKEFSENEFERACAPDYIINNMYEMYELLRIATETSTETPAEMQKTLDDQ